MKEQFLRGRAAVFCTIVTLDYLRYVHVLYDSIFKWSPEAILNVLISDTKRHESSHSVNVINPRIHIIYYDDICSEGIGESIQKKYYNDHHDAFRWSMKPVFMLQLLKKYDSVIYVDWDVHFFNDFGFLFNLL